MALLLQGGAGREVDYIMANSQDLKIYRDAERLLKMQLEMLKKFERFYRYTLGERMISLNIDILEGITHANRQKDKVEALTLLAEKIVVLRSLFRTCVASRAMTERQYVPYAELIESMGKQCTAWRSSKELGIRS